MKQKYDLSFEEAQDLESKTGLDVYSNDGDIFINENDITRTIGNVLQFGIDYQKAIDDAHLESVVAQWKAEEEAWIEQEAFTKKEMIDKAWRWIENYRHMDAHWTMEQMKEHFIKTVMEE